MPLGLKCVSALLILVAVLEGAPIDREALVQRHNPVLREVQAAAPLTVGNGRFAFNVDVTGLQTLQSLYTSEGMPLETLARAYWHSEPNPENYTLADASSVVASYGRDVSYPNREKSPAGQWLRKNPHLFPLGQLGFIDEKGEPLRVEDLTQIQQRLDLWRGRIESEFVWRGKTVKVQTAVAPERDTVAVLIDSEALAEGSLRVGLTFPRGHSLAIKNTPPLDWSQPETHRTRLSATRSGHAWLFERQRDALSYAVLVVADGETNTLTELAPHRFALEGARGGGHLSFTVDFRSSALGPAEPPRAPEQAASVEVRNSLPIITEGRPGVPSSLTGVKAVSGPIVGSEQGGTAQDCAPLARSVFSRSATHWEAFWRSGAALDLSGSKDARAAELERRVVLSQYLCAVQMGPGLPPQETGLTCNSWYGKHHTEMVWWHVAHFALWGRPEPVRAALTWFESVSPRARQTAAERGLRGARWSKMVGPDGRESPGGTSFIVWNQPHPIHLAELLWRESQDRQTLQRWSTLVFETADCMASMLHRREADGVYVLGPPLWIAQELYDQRKSANPTYELVYWRWALETAQHWRERLGLPREARWDTCLAGLAAPTVRQDKYVSMESIPDTWENEESRHDHPSFLMAYGMLPGPGIDPAIMHRTLLATMEQWRWEVKIWGWDYPMIAMSAARLGERARAIDFLLKDGPNNRYLVNGHCPQRRDLGVYLPANGSLLAAVAMMAGGWDGAPDGPAPGFPDDGTWTVHLEGFRLLP